MILFIFLYVCVCVCADSTQLPFGRPAVMFDTRYTLLHHVEFISGYSKDLAMPLWTSYTLLQQVRTPFPLIRLSPLAVALQRSQLLVASVVQ